MEILWTADVLSSEAKDLMIKESGTSHRPFYTLRATIYDYYCEAGHYVILSEVFWSHGIELN